MSSFFTELGKQLAQKWLTLIVLPGLLYVAIATFAYTAGWHDALHISRVVTALSTGVESRPNPHPVTVVIVVSTILLAASLSGLAARALGSVTETAWLGAWPVPFRTIARRMTRARLRRWTKLDDDIRKVYKTTRNIDSLVVDQRRRIAYSKPEYPTWMGDRMNSVGIAVMEEYRLDLKTAWPRLWLLVATAVRDEVRASRTAIDQAATLAGWGLLYCVMGALWWPALLLGFVVMATAWRQARSRIEAYADLVEAVVDLHFDALATAIAPDGEQDRRAQRGAFLTLRLVKAR